MAKTLIILVLLFDGTLVQERYELTREMPVEECMQYGDDHRECGVTISKNPSVMGETVKTVLNNL